MKAKWYFSTLIIILTFFGFTQEKRDLPNQEIVIQFTTDAVTSLDVDKAIAIVKKQLKSIDITSVQVQDLEKGKLKIAYYSSKDVSSVKNVLSNGESIEFGYTAFNPFQDKQDNPLNENSNGYDFEVVEIHNQSDSDSGLNGKLVLSQNQELDRLTIPNVYFAFVHLENNSKSNIVNVAYKVNRNTVIAIDEFSYKIPEVRAGPIC